MQRNRTLRTGLGHFGDAVLAMVVADVLCEKICVFAILQWLDCKGCMLDKRFCCHPERRCGFSSAGSLEELKCDRDHVWKDIWLVTFLFAGMRHL